MKEHSLPSFKLSLIPVLCLVISLVVNVQLFGDDVLNGSIQIVLLASTALTCGLSMWRSKTPWRVFEEGFVKSVASATPAIIVLLLIGAMAGSWMISGITPAMIFYGLRVINPQIFLATACLVSALISVSTGGSWTTIATVGVGLMGIGIALGFEEQWIAGAIISGAYFGDKVSPLSETTNMAASTVGVNLFAHIRYMMKTTVPTFLLTLVIFFVYGVMQTTSATAMSEQLTQEIAHAYHISPWLFVGPALVFLMIVKKFPSIIVLFVGVLLGGVTLILAQPDMVKMVLGQPWSLMGGVKLAMQASYGAMSPDTGSTVLNELVATRGMAGMLNTVWLIICAMCFGGSLEASGMLHSITLQMIKLMRNAFSTVFSTSAACLFLNITTADQYISILLPGRMFAEVYDQQGYRPELLSRTLEDSATVTSVLIPWNSCGMTQSAVLGVATLAYAPFCFFNWMSPVMTWIMAIWGKNLRKTKTTTVAESESDYASVAPSL